MEASRPKKTSEQENLGQLLDSSVDAFNLSKEERQAIKEFNSISTVKKGTILLKEGEIFSKCYFVLKGCVRQYYLVDGEEKTTFFYTEDQSIFSSLGPSDRKPSRYYLECLEETSFTATTSEQEKDLYKRFPRLESLCRATAEEHFSKSQEMFAIFKMSSPEERYRNLLENRPDLINRVPQYQLASYLGMKPESLSRIRKRISVSNLKS